MDGLEDKYKNKKSQQGRERSALQTLQQSETNSSALGGVKKDYSDNIDLALAKLGARSNNHMAKAGEDTSKAFLEQREKSIGTQINTQNPNDDDSQLKRDKNLLNLGIITKEQFNRKWGGKK